MSGTKAGGLKTKETNIQRYGENYYSELGKKGGKTHHPETRHFTRMAKTGGLTRMAKLYAEMRRKKFVEKEETEELVALVKFINEISGTYAVPMKVEWLVKNAIQEIKERSKE